MADRDVDQRDEEIEDKTAEGVKTVFFILFFPAILVGFLYYGLLRVVRLRPSVITPIVLLVQSVLAFVWFRLELHYAFLDTVMDYSNIQDRWKELLLPVGMFYAFIGGFMGLVIVFLELQQMRLNPHRKLLPGNWMYNFQFRRTPREIFKKNRLVEVLKSGSAQSAEKAPLGLNENGEYSIVSRYASEANKHTLIVGNSGSGKALHKDTLIPTVDGMKTVGTVEAGEYILDEDNRPTKVLEKFQPLTPDHYLITFANGAKVRACGDHLWTMSEYSRLTEESSWVTLPTREIFARLENSVSKFSIPKAQGSTPYPVRDLARDPFEVGRDADSEGIPEEYKYSSFSQRIKLLKGVAESYGQGSLPAEVTVGMENIEVLRSVRQVAASLGLNVGDIVSARGRHYLAFAQRGELFSGSTRHWIESVEEIEDDPRDYYCFTVDSQTRLYQCTEYFIPTHNTVTMQSLILNDIKAGTPVVLIDMKRSPEFASKLAKWTHDAGGTFYHFVNGDPESYDVPYSEGQSLYDPLKSGSPTSKADMVLGMREYDTASAVYKSNMQQLLQVLFAMLKYADKSKAPSIAWDQGGIYQLASAVATGNIVELAGACEGTPIEKEAEAISDAALGKTGIKHAMDELQGQMRTIVASEYGRWLKADPRVDSSIDIFKQTQSPGTVILFSLNSDAEPDFARYVGSMIMADLTATSARRRNSQMENQVNVYIDEFQAINPSSVAGLLEKSRESRIAMTLAQQSFEQIIAATQRNGEAYLLSIMDTCSNFIVHAGSTEDSALRLAKILGKHEVDSYRASNKNKSFMFSINWSNKRNQTVQTSKESRWKFDPSEFMALSSPDKNNSFKSTAVIVNKTCSDPLYKDAKGAVARTVWMVPPKEVLAKYYEPKFVDDGETAPPVTPSAILSGPATDPALDSTHITGDSRFDSEESDERDYAHASQGGPSRRKVAGALETLDALTEDSAEVADGEFGWEEVDDDDKGMLSFSGPAFESEDYDEVRPQSKSQQSKYMEYVAASRSKGRAADKGAINRPEVVLPKKPAPKKDEPSVRNEVYDEVPLPPLDF